MDFCWVYEMTKLLTKVAIIIRFPNGSTAVEHKSHNEEVVCSNPDGCSAFFCFYFSFFPSPVESPSSGPSRRYISNIGNKSSPCTGTLILYALQYWVVKAIKIGRRAVLPGANRLNKLIMGKKVF